VADQGDLEALRDVEGRIEDELRRLEKMEKHNEGIRKNSDGIADEIRKAQRQLDLHPHRSQRRTARRDCRAVHPDYTAV
jgi:hypothetical protein